MLVDFKKLRPILVKDERSFHRAVSFNSLVLVKEHLKAGIAPGANSLMLSVFKKCDHELIRLLLDSGCKGRGPGVLIQALRNKDYVLADLLIEEGLPVSFFHLVLRSEYEAVEFLLKKGYRPTADDLVFADSECVKIFRKYLPRKRTRYHRKKKEWRIK